MNEIKMVEWSIEEIEILDKNMKKYPTNEYSNFKRIVLLLDNLPRKRIRDINNRLKYYKEKENSPNLTWEEYCKKMQEEKNKRLDMFFQQKRRVKESKRIYEEININRERKFGEETNRILNENNKILDLLMDHEFITHKIKLEQAYTFIENVNYLMIKTQKIAENEGKRLPQIFSLPIGKEYIERKLIEFKLEYD